MTALALDGFGVNIPTSTYTTGNVALTTTSTDDVICLVSMNNAQGYAGSLTSIETITDTTGQSLEWARRSITQWAANEGSTLEMWWTHSPEIFNGVINITFDQEPDGWNFIAFGVAGAGNPSAPWDINPSLPAPQNFDGPGESTPELSSGYSISATSSFGIIIGGSSSYFGTGGTTGNGDGAGSGGGSGSWEQSGYTKIAAANQSTGHAASAAAAQYNIFTGAQSEIAAYFEQTSDDWGIIADAIAGAVATVRRQPVFFIT